MMKNHLLTIHELTNRDVAEILDLGADVKARPKRYRGALQGKTLAMIFQKPSTRTRVSFEVGMHQLGGAGLYLGAKDLQLGRGETVADTARVLSRYVDGIMARVFGHQDLVDLAEHGTVPVINGLSDLHHPCQALGDLLTLREEKGKLAGLKLVFVGDGNNVANSLIEAGARTGVHVTVACPAGYEPNPQIVKTATADAAATGARIQVTHDVEAAVKGADVIYTDVWTSMGQEAESEKRRRDFQGFQVKAELWKDANPECLFMHCLPAHRGEEVSNEVCDAPYSVIFDEAENRLHIQKAILILLLGER